MLDKVLDRENREGFKELMELSNSLQEKEQAGEESEALDDLENAKASGKASGKRDLEHSWRKHREETFKNRKTMAKSGK